MKIKPNYFVIPLITIAVATLGSLFTTNGMMWYDNTLIQPEITPPDWIFPIAWNIIFILTTISTLIVWNKGKDGILQKIFHRHDLVRFRWIIGLFIANAVLNVVWSLLFFQLQLINLAFAEMILLETTLIALIILVWKTSKTASLLLIPYTLWVGFATYLTYLIVNAN